MRPDIFYVLLELDSGPQSPYGDFVRFQLFLPLRADGRVDTDALGQGSVRYRGVRLRAGDGEANGRIILDSSGKFVLEYEDLRFCSSTLLFRSNPATAGAAVQIAERDREVHDYKVVSMRRVLGAPCRCRRECFDR